MPFKRNEYDRSRYKDKLSASVILLGGKCVICGTIEDLQFDHIDPSTKLFNITEGTGLSPKRFLEELAKCQLLCAYHHSQKSKMEFNYGRNIGESNGQSKLRELDVRYIKYLYSLGHNQTFLSKEFDVGKTTINSIVNGRSWKNVVIIEKEQM